MKSQHKSQHKTEKGFEKGLEKGRVSKNKKSETDKPTTRRTGYLQFCSEMRPIFKERHNPTPKEMMSLLGSEWRKLTKAEQEEWNVKAATAVKDISRTEATRKESTIVQQESGGQEQADNPTVPADDPIDLSEGEAEPLLDTEVQTEKYFCPFCDIHEESKSSLKVHISESHIQSEVAKGSRVGNQLNKIPVPDNQERISKCDICGKMINRHELERHMANSHSNDQGLVEILPDFNVNLLETNEAAECLLIEDESEAVKIKVIKVVMVKRKVLWWPAEVIEENEAEDEYTVKLLNQTKTRITVSKEFIKPFIVDHSQMDGMRREWRDAYMKATKLISKS